MNKHPDLEPITLRVKVQGKIFHTFPQVKGLKNEEKFPFPFTWLQKMYFWRLKYAFQTKYIFWENLQFLRWHLYFKNNDENCLNVLIWSQNIYFWSQNYTSQTIYFFLEILQQHPWVKQSPIKKKVAENEL